MTHKIEFLKDYKLNNKTYKKSQVIKVYEPLKKQLVDNEKVAKVIDVKPVLAEIPKAKKES